MNEILCKECGNEINKHNQDGYHRPGLTCHQTPQDIAVAAIAEARLNSVRHGEINAYKDVVDHWHAAALTNEDVRGLVVWCELRARKLERLTEPATLAENISNAYMEGMQADLSQVDPDGSDYRDLKQTEDNARW